MLFRSHLIYGVCDMSALENKYGYLLLSTGYDEERLSPMLVKANKITGLRYFNDQTRIYVDDHAFEVMEDIDEILAQLENIHPSLR